MHVLPEYGFKIVFLSVNKQRVVSHLTSCVMTTKSCKIRVRGRTVARKSSIGGFTYVLGGVTFVQWGLDIQI